MEEGPALQTRVGGCAGTRQMEECATESKLEQKQEEEEEGG